MNWRTILLVMSLILSLSASASPSPDAKIWAETLNSVKKEMRNKQVGSYIKVHTIGFQVAGIPEAQAFLKEIADKTEGQYIELT